ncbi:MAG: hypothetical protein HC815_23570 [Richelia sp. RM1_1_1]|nr:hypothetical protein [Richelia sp. RM1_1_1]
MLKKFCIKVFQAMNLTVGATSLVAIAVGAATVFGSGGLLCLKKAGVEAIAEKRIQQTLNLGMGSIYLGGVGLVFASAAVCVASVLDTVGLDDDKEEPVTSSNSNSVVFKSSETIPSENTESLYLYQIMRINGCSQLDSKLIVGRNYDEPLRKIVVYDFLDSRCRDSLMELFDQDFDEQLIGKAFSSLKSNPLNAIREFIDFYRPQLEFKTSEGFSSFNLETCAGCRNFHGADEIVCGIHPYGWDDENCPDWQSNNRQKRVNFPFEREQVIVELNQSIEANQATLIKNDDGTLTLWDEYTNRRFGFSWAGIRLDDSDKLVELGEHARLLSYVQYFSVRAVIEFDYSSKIDKFAQQLKGIANIEISDTGINVRVNSSPKRNIYTERQYRFKLNGIPLYPYESIVPQELKYNYNLVTFVEWLKVNKIRIRK